MKDSTKVIILSIVFGLLAGTGASIATNVFLQSPVEIVEKSKIKFSTNLIEEESAMIYAIEKVNPAVVSIVASKEFQQYVTDPYSFFFGLPFELEPNRSPVPQRDPRQNESQSEKRQVGGGTGFLVTADGLLLTNRHVVNDDSAEYTVLTADGNKYYADVVSKDPTNDLAVLQLFVDEDMKKKPDELPTLVLGDSDSLKIGSKVLAIGNALSEFDNTTTSGIISGKGRNVLARGSLSRVENLTNLLQTDAAINPGNSGGPLVNLKGEVIGINTAIAEQANGIGFAIPINDIKSSIESVQKVGRIVKPFLGVRYTEITPEIAHELRLPVEYGAYLMDDLPNRVPAVVADSPADKAGLLNGDIIVAVNDQSLQDISLIRAVGIYTVGDKIKLRVLRNNKEIDITVVLEEFIE